MNYPGVGLIGGSVDLQCVKTGVLCALNVQLEAITDVQNAVWPKVERGGGMAKNDGRRLGKTDFAGDGECFEVTIQLQFT